MKKKSIFIGGAFREHQILYMIPIIDGICEQKKISTIIFEKRLSKSISKIPFVKKFISSREILYLKDLNEKNFFYLNIIQKIIYSLFIIFVSFFVNRNLLLNKKHSWFKNQFFHSIWDTCIIFNKESLSKFELKSRIITALQLSQKILDINNIKKKNTCYAIIQHTVYADRFLFALLRKKNIETYVQTKHVLMKQDLKKDFGFKHLDKNIFKDSYKYINEKIISYYWLNILKGKSKYLEARIAGNIKSSKNKILLQKKENVIMLHIFKDSPFTNIDRTRVYSDYYIWILETLKIIKDSNEKWVIRKHPSSDRWGENQAKIVGKIFKKVFGNNIPKHITYEDNRKSNLMQFKIAKRVVTFSGNSHLEAACFGIRPIIISNTTLCNFNKNLFYKPKSNQQYRKLLLSGKDSNFLISKKRINQCKRMLYLIHNVINYGEDINSYHVFRNDPQRIFKILYKNILFKLNKNYRNMYDIGYHIGKKYNQSLNKKYLNKFIT